MNYLRSWRYLNFQEYAIQAQTSDILDLSNRHLCGQGSVVMSVKSLLKEVDMCGGFFFFEALKPTLYI